MRCLNLGVSGIALAPDRIGRFEASSVRERGPSPRDGCVDRGWVGPSELMPGGFLKESAASRAARVDLAVDAPEQIVRDGDHHLGHG